MAASLTCSPQADMTQWQKARVWNTVRVMRTQIARDIKARHPKWSKNDIAKETHKRLYPAFPVPVPWQITPPLDPQPTDPQPGLQCELDPLPKEVNLNEIKAPQFTRRQMGEWLLWNVAETNVQPPHPAFAWWLKKVKDSPKLQESLLSSMMPSKTQIEREDSSNDNGKGIEDLVASVIKAIPTLQSRAEGVGSKPSVPAGNGESKPW